MKKIRILALCLMLAVVVTFSFVSCARNNKADYDNSYAGGAEIAPEVSDKTESGSVNVDIGSALEGSEEYERKIIKTANISAQTLEFDKSVELVEQLCEGLGGYIESSSVSGNGINSRGGSRHASYTIRIPAENLDGFGDGLDKILKITSSSSNSDEVTSTYYDIKSRIEVLEMQKAALTELYEQYVDYANVDYLIELQDKLYDVIAEIEAYETQIRLYDNKIAYSTVYLNIQEVEEYIEVNETFGEKISAAFSGGWEAFVDFCSALAIAFVSCLPFIVTGGVIAVGIVFLVKANKKRRRDKKQNENKE